MKQRIINATPPNYLQIVRRFPNAQALSTIFSYGDRIYYRGRQPLTKALIAHEGVHGERQGQTTQEIEGWWERYLTDPQFVIAEEVPAHYAEWVATKKRHGPGTAYLKPIVERLSGPLYGNLLTYAQAQHAIITGNFAV